MPWLLLALAGGLLAGALIEQFEDTLEAVGALAAFVWQRNEPFAVELALVAVCVVARVFGYLSRG